MDKEFDEKYNLLIKRFRKNDAVVSLLREANKINMINRELFFAEHGRYPETRDTLQMILTDIELARTIKEETANG